MRLELGFSLGSSGDSNGSSRPLLGLRLRSKSHAQMAPSRPPEYLCYISLNVEAQAGRQARSKSLKPTVSNARRQQRAHSHLAYDRLANSQAVKLDKESESALMRNTSNDISPVASKTSCIVAGFYVTTLTIANPLAHLLGHRCCYQTTIIRLYAYNRNDTLACQ